MRHTKAYMFRDSTKAYQFKDRCKEYGLETSAPICLQFAPVFQVNIIAADENDIDQADQFMLEVET